MYDFWIKISQNTRTMLYILISAEQLHCFLQPKFTLFASCSLLPSISGFISVDDKLVTGNNATESKRLYCDISLPETEGSPGRCRWWCDPAGDGLGDKAETAGWPSRSQPVLLEGGAMVVRVSTPP